MVGLYLLGRPDFPELTTFGEDRDEALGRAVNALEEAVAARIHDRKDIPMPSPGGEGSNPTANPYCCQSDSVPGHEGSEYR